MNQKAAYSVLFCALLASSFVHELRAKGLGPVSSHRHHKALQSRASSNEVCRLECHFSGNLTTTVGITIEVIENLLVVANFSGQGAIVLDVSEQIVLVLNGTTGAGIAIDLVKQVGVSISGGLWVGGSAALTTLITGKLSGGLKAIWSLSGVVSFNVSSITKAQLTIIAGVVGVLVAGIKADIASNQKVALEILLAIAVEITALLNGDLKGALALIAAGEAIVVIYDLAALLVVLRTIGQIVVKVAGSLAKLVALNIIIDLALILAARSGIEAFGNLILQLAVNATIRAALVALLVDEAAVLLIIAGLGGLWAAGISGWLTVAAQAALLASNKTAVEIVIIQIIKVVVWESQSLKANITADFEVALGGLLTVVEYLGAEASLTAVVSLVKKLQAGTLVIGGINISALITALAAVYIGTSVALLATVVTSVLLLKAVVAENVLIVKLLLILASQFATSFGVALLIGLGISISASLTLAGIIQASASLIWALITGQLLSALKQIKGVGAIVVALASAVGASFSTFVAAGSKLIIAWFEVQSGFHLGASSSDKAAASLLYSYSSSVSIQIGINATITGSASGGGGGGVIVG